MDKLTTAKIRQLLKEGAVGGGLNTEAIKYLLDRVDALKRANDTLSKDLARIYNEMQGGG